jgi:hypothetical protein
MFKKPFNKVEGEIRECKHCSKEFHTMKPVWRCGSCVNEYQKKTKPPYKAKEQYPFDNKGTEASNRFGRIRKELRIAWEGGREELTKHYSKQLKEIEDNGILVWIWDRGCESSKKDKSSKSRSVIKRDYPDTRNYYEE